MCNSNHCHGLAISSQVAEWDGETAGTLATVMLIIAIIIFYKILLYTSRQSGRHAHSVSQQEARQC